MKRIARIAIYARVSTERQETENQIDQMRRFAASQQWEIEEEYIDHKSGKNADRVQLRRLFEDASQGTSI